MTPERVALKHRTLVFVAYVTCVVAVSARALGAVVDLSWHDATASHHVLAPFISIALIFRGRERVFQQAETDARGGLVLVLAGLALALWSAGVNTLPISRDALSLTVAAIVVQLWGGFLLIYGRRAARAAMFPLIFLACLVPFPSTVLNGATLVLKAGSAEMVAGLFTLAGTPFHRDGFVFSLPHFAIEIADNCSGIRSSIALLLTGALAGHLFLSTQWRKALLLIAILPIAIVKNAVRIVSLSLLAVHIDRGFINGQLHHEGGVVFFVFALAILAPLLTILRNSEPATSTHSN